MCKLLSYISFIDCFSEMAGKDADPVVKQGFMVKRSQNKKRFTPVNFKQRWFVLTKRHLIYYDSDSEVSSNTYLSDIKYSM